MRARFPMLLVRIVVGLVFLTEGVLKFLRPEELGSGRFAQIGLPMPYALAPFVGGVECLCGALVLFNLFAGEAALALLMVIITALVSTKIPIITAKPLWIFHGPKPGTHLGVLSFLHEARTDLAMLFCLIAILIDSGMRMFGGRRGSRR